MILGFKTKLLHGRYKYSNVQLTFKSTYNITIFYAINTHCYLRKLQRLSIILNAALGYEVSLHYHCCSIE